MLPTSRGGRVWPVYVSSRPARSGRTPTLPPAPGQSPTAKPYKLTESDVPERRSQSLYADIIADFIAQGTESMQVTIEGMQPATLRAGLRRALNGKEADGVMLAQRWE